MEKNIGMTDHNAFDVIIIGGSYSGLAAGMALGRALKKVLIIDDGKPCNKQTPHSHNFITNDGKTPKEIADMARLQVKKYNTVTFFNGSATNGTKTETGFKINTASGDTFASKKLIFATGIRDLLPDIQGVAACWGISVLHCPYCHGYEVRHEKTAILSNGDAGYDFAALISNWTKDLTLFTNGQPAFTPEQTAKLQQHNIQVVDKQIEKLEHNNGQIQNIVFRDGTKSFIKALYATVRFEQHCKIPESLGCQLSEEGHIKVDVFGETTTKNIFACGDNAAKMRTVANAVAMGTTAGMAVSKGMILEEFKN